MRSVLSWMCGCSLVAVAAGQDVHHGYLDHMDLVGRIQSVQVNAPDQVAVRTLGTSREGRAIYLLSLTNDTGSSEDRPQLLLVAGADGRHLMGTELVMRVVDELLESHSDLLDEVEVLVVPRLNPDAAEANLGPLNAGRAGTSRLVDTDRDGLMDEDHPMDLDGDGVIVQMRLLDPSLKHPPTHLVDPADQRLMKTPDRAAGERPVFAVMLEGMDQDGDGLVAEDGPSDVELDRNFMHLWPEHANHAGPYPLSEPEARVMAELVLENPRIFAAVVYGPHDTVLNLPDHRGRDTTGRIPRELHEGDKPLYETLGALYREHTAQSRTTDAPNEGSLHGWLYAHRGIPTVATTGWGRPDPTPPAEGTEPPEAAEDAPKPADGEAAGWLAYAEKDRGGVGFVPWHPFDHPQFGRVEIGGFVPGFRRNPPLDVIEGLAPGHAAFMGALADHRPRLVVAEPEVESLGGGLHRVRWAMSNEGELPVITRMGRDNRAIRPTAVRLGVPLERIIEGSPVYLQRGLDADGGRVAYEWVIRGDGDPVSIDIDDPIWGQRTINVALPTGGDR